MYPRSLVRPFRLAAHALCAAALTAHPLVAAPAATTKPLSLKIFQRLAGVPLLPSDPRADEMDQLIQAGKTAEAAHIATDDPSFYGVTIRDWAAVMSNKAESPVVDFDDFQAMIIGVVRDDLDARLLLSGNFRYAGDPSLHLPGVSVADNNHYLQLDASGVDLKDALVRQEPQWDGIAESAGLLTTRAWAQAHLVDGTNQWKDPGLPDIRVRRDVTRRPGDDPSTYENTCRTCHAAMDGLTGAWANWDYVNDSLTYYGLYGVAPKMNKNNTVYPAGYVTVDNSWINLAVSHQNTAFGWRGATSGAGINAFGTMMANSRGFSRCMAQRAFEKVCRRSLTADEQSGVLNSLADQFEQDGYKLRGLFETVAALPACIQ